MARAIFAVGKSFQRRWKRRLRAMRFACTGFQKENWTQQRAASVQERLDREIKRRMEAAPISRTEASARLSGPALMGQASGRLLRGARHSCLLRFEGNALEGGACLRLPRGMGFGLHA
jgi:hypothetical protein